MLYWLEPQLQPLVKGHEAFDQMMTMEGEPFRREPGRETVRVTIGRRSYFIKRHFGVGWGEVLKNLLVLKWPVLGAANEWQAIPRLREIGVATPGLVGFGQRGWNPARLESFVVTEALTNTLSLEELLAPGSPYRELDASQRLKLKWALLEEVANIARKLHENGFNHRDFYLCHFHLERDSLRGVGLGEKARLWLIDLHRMQIRAATPRRWRLKDLAGLYHSALDAGLSKTDCFRFIHYYGGTTLRQELSARSPFWRRVSAKARRLYRKAYHRWPAMPDPKLGL